MKTNCFYRLIWFGCMSICLPIILAGVIYYRYSMHNELSDISVNNQMSLRMVQDYSEKALKDIESASLQLALDPAVVNSFSETNFGTDYVAQRALLDKINVQTMNNNLIGNIYYYNQPLGMVLSFREGYQALDDFAYKADIAYLEHHSWLSQWNELPAGKPQGYLSFAIRIPTLASGKAEGLLVTEVKESTVTGYYRNVLSLTQSRSIFMIDPNQRILFQSQKSQQLSPSLIGQLTRSMEAQNKTLDSFSATDRNGTKFYYSYLKSPSGYLYIAAIPYRTIQADLDWIRLVTAGAVALLILVSILLTIFTLRWAYNPIKRLVDSLSQEKHALGKLWQHSIPTLQERLLQQWLGDNYIDGPTLVQECQRCQIPTERLYIVMLVKWEDPHNRWTQPQKHKSLLTFASINIMKELLRNHAKLQGYVLHDNQGYGTALLHFNRNDSMRNCKLLAKQYAESVHAALTTFLKLHVWIGIGSGYTHIADTQLSYKESRTALEFRLFKETQHIFEFEKLEATNGHAAFTYPYLLENQIMDCLYQNDMEKAGSALEEFFEAVKSAFSYSAVHQCFCLLLSSLIHAFETRGVGLIAMLEHDLFEEFLTKETTKEITAWFRESVFPLLSSLAGAENKTYGKQIVEEVRKYIIANPSLDFSQTECAERFQISPTYLSRIFKKELGISFMDFIAECKINEARRLLMDTDAAIGQIASALGYTHRTFNRNFKRILKMSPSEYRVQYKYACGCLHSILPFTHSGRALSSTASLTA